MPAEDDYRHHGTGVLRAAAQTVAVDRWPDPDDADDCRSWLADAWTLPGIAAAVRHASPVLSRRVEAILTADTVTARDLNRATSAVIRYVLRADGRSTPFGTFAGVGTVSVGDSAHVAWRPDHRPVVRAEARWLHEVVRRLEQCPELVARLDVTVDDTAEVRAGRWISPGPETVSVRLTSAVELVREQARTPVRFGELADALRRAFPTAGDPTGVLSSLLRHGFLLTSLRAPGTVTDPLGHLVDRLRHADAAGSPMARLADDLVHIHRQIRAHNDVPDEQARIRLADRMRQVADSVRTPLSVDLRLDAHVRLPHAVAEEMCRAAGVLARLVRQNTGSRDWRDYFAAFVERHGTGTLVPVADVVDRDHGIGLPGGYPGGAPQSGRHVFSDRDALLLAVATEATARGDSEVNLDDALVDRLAAVCGGREEIPPHLDLGAQVHATGPDALDRGEFTLTVAPGRAAGTLTSRFTTLLPEAALDTVFSALPTTTTDAVPAQLSFTPIHPSAENVCRVPAYLPQRVSIGEYADDDAIRLDDLAITADRHRLHLVSLSRRRVVEPQVLHALAPKQQPVAARLVGELARALDPGWIGFDWGPVAETLPFRPRVRSGRAILAAASWRLTATDLPEAPDAHDEALARWRATWRCPARVRLRDFDQLLPLDLDVPAHRRIVYRHLRRHDHAVLLEGVDPAADGWIGGHAHSVVLPLTTTRPPAPAVPVHALPVLTAGHGHPPGAPGSSWLYAKLFVPADRMDHLLAQEFPALLDDLAGRPWWFVRYPRPRDGEEPDHLRLRIRVHDDATAVFTAVAGWAAGLRARGRIGRFALDTYFPEIGRYHAITAAEDVFATDSRAVLAGLVHPPDDDLAATVPTALTMFDLATAFLGSRTSAADWLHRSSPAASPERADVTAITRLVREGRPAPASRDVTEAREARAGALARYRHALPETADVDAVLHSLLHMHHNRALGVDRDREAVCLRLARQAAATWRATGTTR
ncbi:lantibiotic dehydratase [Saccharothrix violaceirubra]|uniref:Thiopeptide-type bacteriocin biosynthesis protein n=1 Tax=Saccharothrix violaceirubra TaxID=413306 RepID=A0A7W7T1D0_9PSEU|nr:lantibiotic dehydratase [Saccharothrix violaceirubra]MBB4963495.1 thiopeptide-type bacteriocin biosynthesis protein [Saccharothrix violaceirubra]